MGADRQVKRLGNRVVVTLAAAISVLAGPLAAQTGSSGARLMLFGDTNFEGASRAFTRDVPNLGDRSVNAGDFAASAIAIGVWQVCMDAGYRTRCRQISGEVPDLGPDRQSISSIRLIRPPTAEELRAGSSGGQTRQAATSPPATVPAPAPAPSAAPAPPARLTLYNHAGFQGGTREIDRNVANLGGQPWDAGDFAGSLVAVGLWEVCMDSNYRTRCRQVEGEVADLGPDRQSISSARLLRAPLPGTQAAVPTSATPGQRGGQGQTTAAAPPPPPAAPRDPTVVDRIAQDAAQAAEERAREEARRRAREAVGNLLGGRRN